MKIRKYTTLVVAVLYLIVVYISPSYFINKPKFLLLNILKFPLRMTNKIFYDINYMINSKHLIEENISLNQTVNTLTHQLLQYQQTDKQNRRLKRLLEFEQKSPFSLVSARIISKDSTNFSNSILIDKGRDAGIRNDTPVVAESGLLGRVVLGSSKTSRVMLITDPNSRVSAIVARTHQLGMVYGISANLCKLQYLPLDADIRLGDEVITSGFSDIYPKNILIGRVVKIIREKRGLSLSALIEPALDITKQEEVSCIR
ncbi:rod shape-determining protein MreC [Candidatus Omnitrophota bacterium]